MITWFLDFVHCLLFKREHSFGNWICSHPQLKVWEARTLLGLAVVSALNPCTSYARYLPLDI